jgi:hypothetical protein
MRREEVITYTSPGIIPPVGVREGAEIYHTLERTIHIPRLPYCKAAHTLLSFLADGFSH